MNVMIAQMQERYYCRICIKIKHLKELGEVMNNMENKIIDLDNHMIILNFLVYSKHRHNK